MKNIKYDDYLKAYGLFSLAHAKQREVDMYESEMNKIFSEDNGSHLSDAVYEYNTKSTAERFNEAISNMGFSIPKPPKD